MLHFSWWLAKHVYRLVWHWTARMCCTAWDMAESAMANRNKTYFLGRWHLRAFADETVWANSQCWEQRLQKHIKVLPCFTRFPLQFVSAQKLLAAGLFNALLRTRVGVPSGNGPCQRARLRPTGVYTPWGYPFQSIKAACTEEGSKPKPSARPWSPHYHTLPKGLNWIHMVSMWAHTKTGGSKTTRYHLQNPPDFKSSFRFGRLWATNFFISISKPRPRAGGWVGRDGAGGWLATLSPISLQRVIC